MKKDIREINKVARMFGMDHDARQELRRRLEKDKKSGEPGSRRRGDFTWAELAEKARELLAEQKRTR
jgi:hypothetical protein